jgi:cytochrome c peroxidase
MERQATVRGRAVWLLRVLVGVLMPAALGLGAGVASPASRTAGLLDWQPAERERIAALGPWPPALAPDPSNRVSGRPAAILFGEALFHSTRLSRVAGLRCASCHEPWRQFTDGRRTGLGAEPGDRNTPTLLNIAQQHWFGWDGANDSLWAQSIRPLLDEREMRADPAFLAARLREDQRLCAMYREAFGREPPADDTTAMVDLAKALAAYQETLVSGRTPFDAFRDAMARGDEQSAARFPLAAQRGLRLFIGRAQCGTCHAGAVFSDGRFHASSIRSTRRDGGPDDGRTSGLKLLRASAYSLAGRFNDGSVRSAEPEGGDGAFRTPPLRELASTAPYMHDGSVANLCDAVLPHATADAPPSGLQGLPPVLPLSLAERRDLVAFLLSLSARPAAGPVEPSTFECR